MASEYVMIGKSDTNAKRVRNLMQREQEREGERQMCWKGFMLV
jgi:hypothetical protein